jgi:catechol 2,3-dioxygenase-like lactoylglutathione lyase family enzyme
MLAGQRLVGFLPSRDLARSRAFFEGVLGLRVHASDPYAVLCSAGGNPLRIALVESFSPHPFTALGWTVPSIVRQIDALRKGGVACERFGSMPQDARGSWTAPDAAQVAWCKDADGNLLSLTETGQ